MFSRSSTMKLRCTAIVVLFSVLVLLPHLSSAASSWAGSNLFYAAGLSVADQNSLFSALRASNVKVLRVWLDGQLNRFVKNTQITPYKDFEPDAVGTFDDTVLNRLDDVMFNAAKYGIKLQISLHSWNALSSPDAYGKKYGTDKFYTNAEAIGKFQDRIFRALFHVNPHNGKAWKDCNEYIFGFEAQNEAFNGLSLDFFRANAVKWQCMMAQSIKSALGGNKGILVLTGGGGYVDVSLMAGYFTCAYLDVLAIHAYGPGDLTTSKLAPYVTQAQQNGKKLLMQEWGACYTTAVNNACHLAATLSESTRAANINNWADQMGKAGVPWMYWQVLPNSDPHQDWDYEVGITDGAIWNTLSQVAKSASGYSSPFDYSQWLPQVSSQSS